MSRRRVMASCLMVTPADDSRIELIARSIACYHRQTYPMKELLIVGDGLSRSRQQRLLRLARRFGNAEIRCLFPAGRHTLGALRNIGLKAARGDVLCQWDDDDLRHPDCLRIQMSDLELWDYSAVCLQNFLHFYS